VREGKFVCDRCASAKLVRDPDIPYAKVRESGTNDPWQIFYIYKCLACGDGFDWIRTEGGLADLRPLRAAIKAHEKNSRPAFLASDVDDVLVARIDRYRRSAALRRRDRDIGPARSPIEGPSEIRDEKVALVVESLSADEKAVRAVLPDHHVRQGVDDGARRKISPSRSAVAGFPEVPRYDPGRFVVPGVNDDPGLALETKEGVGQLFPVQSAVRGFIKEAGSRKNLRRGIDRAQG